MATPIGATTAPAPKPAASPGRMSLAGITSGRVATPVRALVYGEPGIGKTTFASGAPAPIFLSLEDGSYELDVQRAPRPDDGYVWADVIAFVDLLEREQHSFKTLVIDTAGELEELAGAFVCQRDGKPDLESYGYGKGPRAVATEIKTSLLSRLEKLGRRMNVIILAHAQVKTKKNPEIDDHDNYEPRLMAPVAGLLAGWVHALLFARLEVVTHKSANDERVRGIATGKRELCTSPAAPYAAKNRLALEAKIPLSYRAFENDVANGRALKDELDALILKLEKRGKADDKAVAASAREWSKTGKSAKEYREAKERLEQRLSEETKPAATPEEAKAA